MWFYHAVIGVHDHVNDRKCLYNMSIDRIQLYINYYPDWMLVCVSVQNSLADWIY